MTEKTIRRPYGHHCIDCGGNLIRRGSAMQNALLQKIHFMCRDPVCGATFTAYSEITHRLSPPSRPNPEIDLPYATGVMSAAIRKAQGTPPEPSETKGITQ